jgi:hypothetical protein
MHSSLSKCICFLAGVVLAFFYLGSVTSVLAADVTLAWNANPEPTLTGYKVYYGTSSRSYGVFISAGNVTSYRVTGLSSGTYYFAVTAYDASGNESGLSNEISATISSTPVAGSRCDVSGDGVSNALDLQTEINAILVGSNSTSFDINRDSTVNALDLQTLGNVVLGVSSCP